MTNPYVTRVYDWWKNSKTYQETRYSSNPIPTAPPSPLIRMGYQSPHFSEHPKHKQKSLWCDLNNTGWWLSLPLWKMMEFVSWDYDSPNIWKNKKNPNHQPEQWIVFIYLVLTCSQIDLYWGWMCIEVLNPLFYWQWTDGLHLEKTTSCRY